MLIWPDCPVPPALPALYLLLPLPLAPPVRAPVFWLEIVATLASAPPGLSAVRVVVPVAATAAAPAV